MLLYSNWKMEITSFLHFFVQRNELRIADSRLYELWKEKNLPCCFGALIHTIIIPMIVAIVARIGNIK